MITTDGDDLAGLVRGAAELERTERGLLPHRLPRWVREQVPDGQLLMVEAQPAGVRIAFRTSATLVELETVPTKRVYAGAPPRPDGTYDLVVDGVPVGGTSVAGGDVMTVDLMRGAVDVEVGAGGTAAWRDLDDRAKDVEVWLPHDEQTVVVALRTDAPVEPLAPRPRTWLHHGSSISQGSNAASPTGTWPAVAALAAGVDLVNLGLSGSALLDPAVGRVLRDTPADLISLELGINVVNTDVMRLRAFGPAVHGLLDTIREGHPTTPLVVVSPLLCPAHEHTPGPTALDPAALAEGRVTFVATGDPAEVAAGRLTLSTVRAELARVVDQRSDEHLHLVDGLDLYGEDDAARLPLPDGLHPDAATHRLIGERFAARALVI